MERRWPDSTRETPPKFVVPLKVSLKVTEVLLGRRRRSGITGEMSPRRELARRADAPTGPLGSSRLERRCVAVARVDRALGARRKLMLSRICGGKLPLESQRGGFAEGPISLKLYQQSPL